MKGRLSTARWRLTGHRTPPPLTTLKDGGKDGAETIYERGGEAVERRDRGDGRGETGIEKGLELKQEIGKRDKERQYDVSADMIESGQ